MSCINNVCTYLTVQKLRVWVAIAIVFLCVLCINVTYKGCKRKRVSVLIDYRIKGYFLTEHSEKGYQIQNVEPTV